jgi:hypothetical protein
MVNIFHAKRVILMTGVYSLVIPQERLVIGMPSPVIKSKQKYNKNKLRRKVDCLVGTREFG